MGGKGSKPKPHGSVAVKKQTSKKKHEVRKKASSSSSSRGLNNKRKDSNNSDLDEDDCNLVTVPLDSSVTDKRLSKARELIASGRPISISLEATIESDTGKADENDFNGKNFKGAIWEDDGARKVWKEQLGLMRHFYDWEEIPLEFFIDAYVGGGGEAVRRRRLSLSLVTEPEPAKADKVDNIQPVLPHNKPAPADAARHQRAASVNSPPPPPVPLAHVVVPGTILESPPPSPSALALAAAPSGLKVPPPPLPHRRTRAASVAIGESFPLPLAQALQKQAKTEEEDDTKRMSQAASPSRRVINNLKEEDSRPRRASATSLDQVYGRLGRPGGAYDRFEVENPVIHGSPQQPARRPTISDKKPEQYKNMTSVIDPTQFATERRNTRVTATSRKSVTASKPVCPSYDYGGRPSTTSTAVLESQHSGMDLMTTAADDGGEVRTSRTMSDWL